MGREARLRAQFPPCPECGRPMRDPKAITRHADGRVERVCGQCEALFVEEGYLWPERERGSA